MIKLIEVRDCVVLLRYRNPAPALTMLDYDARRRKPCSVRELFCRVPAVLGKQQLEKIVSSKPHAKIIRKISHEDWFGEKILNEDGSPYLDEFGLPVYIFSDLDWEGHFADVDLRYEGTSFTTPEVFEAYEPAD